MSTDEGIIVTPKEVIDVAKKEEVKEKIAEMIMYFTVTVAHKEKMKHYLVRSESAIKALAKVQEEMKAPVVGVHITEYSGYLEV